MLSCTAGQCGSPRIQPPFAACGGVRVTCKPGGLNSPEMLDALAGSPGHSWHGAEPYNVQVLFGTPLLSWQWEEMSAPPLSWPGQPTCFVLAACCSLCHRQGVKVAWFKILLYYTMHLLAASYLKSSPVCCLPQVEPCVHPLGAGLPSVWEDLNSSLPLWFQL